MNGHRLLTVRQRRVLAALTKRTTLARFEAHAITVRSLEHRGLVGPAAHTRDCLEAYEAGVECICGAGWQISITEEGRRVYAEDRRQEGHPD